MGEHIASCMCFFFESTYTIGIDKVFALPVTYDLIAVFLFALTGSLIAIKRGFDPVGVSIITIISGAGGAIIRDAIFLNIKPAVIVDWRYSAVLLGAIAAVLLIRSVLTSRPIALIIIVTEALGIGLNSVYGTQKTLDAKASVYAAVIVGLINAVGGRLMRDTVMGKKRNNLVPGRMYGFAAAASIGVFLVLSEYLDVNTQVAAWSAITIAFGIRMTAVSLGIKSKALTDYYDPSERIVVHVSKVVNPYVSRFEKLKLLKRRGKEGTDHNESGK